MSYAAKSYGEEPFYTSDFDVVCPDIATADECAEILKQFGFEHAGATFRQKNGKELDILVADPELPEGAATRYYNAPSLRSLWEARERVGGILLTNDETLIMNKLLFARENGGKDLETVAIFFRLEPGKLDPVIRKIAAHNVPEERETMLYALYMSMVGDSDAKAKIEKILLDDMSRNNVLSRNDTKRDIGENRKIMDKPGS
jgi:hypothetical protein